MMKNKQAIPVKLYIYTLAAEQKMMNYLSVLKAVMTFSKSKKVKEKNSEIKKIFFWNKILYKLILPVFHFKGSFFFRKNPYNSPYP